MSLQERSATDRVLAARERYVAAGVATPELVVDRAEGARVWDVDGREYIDFAGGLGCQNTGHGLPPRSPRSTSRSTATCTSASWSACTSRTWRSAAGSPSSRPAGATNRRAARQLGRRGDRERGQDRARRDRPPRCRRLRPRLPRTHAAHDDDDEQGRPVQARLRALRARGLPRAGAVPVPRRHVRRRDPRARDALQGRCRPASRSPASCSSRCRAKAASSTCRTTFRRG